MELEANRSAEKKARALANALREVFIEPDCHLSYRDVLNLSSDCSGCAHGRGGFLAEIGRFMEERFRKQILHVMKIIKNFEDIEISAEKVYSVRSSVGGWLGMVYGTLEHQPVPASPDHNGTVEPECLKAIESLKAIVELLQSHAKVVDAVTKVLLPLNRRCYFMDRKMSFVDRVYHKMLFKALKKCKAGTRKFVGLSLLVSNITLAYEHSFDGADAFSDGIRYLLSILDGFGMKSRVLASARELIAAQDLHILATRRSDFEAVFVYFKEQKYIYPPRFHRRVESLVLAKLYSDCDESLIVDRLVRLEGLEFILMLFERGGIKGRLLGIYERFIGRVCGDFEEFLQIYTVNREILRILDDEDFRNASRAFFENFFESRGTCRRVSDFVDGSLETASGEVYDMIACITETSKNPESFLRELQQRLSLRLLSGSSDLEKEIDFLKRFKRMHSESMICMVGDYRSKEPSLLLMTMCKWPTFRTECVLLPGNHPITLFKDKVETKLRERRKRVSWTDSLSKVCFELFGKTLETTLFQYSAITGILQQGEIIARDKFHLYFDGQVKDDVTSTVKIKKSGVKIPKVYSGQFSSLLGSVLLQTDEFFVLNPNFVGPIKFGYEFQSCSDESEDDRSYNIRSFHEAKISRVLKRSKEMTLKELQDSIGDVEPDEMRGYLAGLQDKGFVELLGDTVVYCP